MVNTGKLVHHIPSWRTYNIVLSTCCIIISFIFGLANKRYALTDDGNLAKLCSYEPAFCTFQPYLSYLIWIPFFASLLLFLACWFNSNRLIHCCVGFIITDLVLSFVII